ncbi:hypothetical protein DYB37_013626 [Aphanomyces astaci]|uniref:DDE-1 domain-containing protein n=1 Tax=Aphanomyces astaci TaxID=112090 RepID=A0A3R7BP25_APHAT|nr:hypothetical protein DYB37_013626 [Aphanomyces astaci]
MAWMDARVWALYLRQLLKPKVREPSVLLLDNFDTHVSKEGLKIARRIMPPFKRHLRNLWLEEELIEGDDSEVDVLRSNKIVLFDSSCH